jgi:GTPase
LGLALALNVPVYVVVTKIDMCPPNILETTLKLLQKILKSPGCRKIPLLVNSMDDVVVAASNFISQRSDEYLHQCWYAILTPSPCLRVCPVFQISNVTGENLILLRSFINLLNSRSPARDDEPAEFQIDDTFSVPVSVGWGYANRGQRHCNLLTL